MSEVCYDYMYFLVAHKESVWPHTLRQNFMRDTTNLMISVSYTTHERACLGSASYTETRLVFLVVGKQLHVVSRLHAFNLHEM